VTRLEMMAAVYPSALAARSLGLTGEAWMLALSEAARAKVTMLGVDAVRYVVWGEEDVSPGAAHQEHHEDSFGDLGGGPVVCRWCEEEGREAEVSPAGWCACPDPVRSEAAQLRQYLDDRRGEWGPGVAA